MAATSISNLLASLTCPCREHNTECGRETSADHRCHLDAGHEGECLELVPRRPLPENLRGGALRAHNARIAKDRA